VLLTLHRPQIVEEPLAENRWKFSVEPLEPGFGHTLGNALRRTLLSSIPGTAVTQVRIEGVQHEFSTIPGVKEDVVEIILNIKDLVLRSEHEGAVSVFLRATGPKDVTAADLDVPAGIEVLNPDLRLATLNKSGRLNMELTVERGKGYVSADTNKEGVDSIGVIPVDSVYSPVVRVAYTVEPTRVEGMTNFDRLVIDVETSGAVSPRDAFGAAGRTLVDLFGLVSGVAGDAEALTLGPTPEEEFRSSEMALPIEELELSVRSYNCLKRESVNTIGELVQRSEDDLMDIRNFGQKSIDEVKEKLAQMGLGLRD
jgi:DNA-directed RNA polymerase subunit alpha